MKSLHTATLILCLLLVTSCKKDKALGPGGTWSINASSYAAYTCVANATTASLLTTNNKTKNSTNGADLLCAFYKALPAVSGTYTIIDAGTLLSAPNQIEFVAAPTGINGVTYLSSGGQTVQVNVTNGKISISQSNIDMYTNGTPTGTFTLKLDIKELD